MVEVFAVRIPRKMEECEYHQLLQSVGEKKRKRVERFCFKEDAYRTLLAEILIRTIVCRKFEVMNREIEIVADAYGKPAIHTMSDFSFNLSHAGEWVVCAVHQLPIGIDIEKIMPVDFDIAMRFFSQEEYQFLQAKAGEPKLHYFYDLWTLKESYLKAVGKGLSIPLDSFTLVKLREDQIQLVSNNADHPWFFKQYSLDPHYKLSVCALTPDFPKELVKTDVSALYQEFVNNYV